MSIGSGSDAENILVWGATDTASHPHKAGLWDVRGPAASVRRDALFRRSLVAADLIAFIAAILLTVVLDGRALAIGWACLLGLPVIIVVAKVIGLYDRDESLLRKTTLDEAPRLLQLAALGAVMVWISGGLLISEGFNRRQAAILLGLLVLLLLIMRTLARAAALAASPTERCLVIGDELAAETIRAKLNGLSGVKAEVVARVDLDNVAPWTSETFSEQRLGEVRDLAANLDVHRAVIAPSSADAGEMLNLVRRRRPSACASACCRGSSRWSAPRSCSTSSTASRCSASGASGCPAPRRSSSALSISSVRRSGCSSSRR